MPIRSDQPFHPEPPHGDIFLNRNGEWKISKGARNDTSRPSLKDNSIFERPRSYYGHTTSYKFKLLFAFMVLLEVVNGQPNTRIITGTDEPEPLDLDAYFPPPTVLPPPPPLQNQIMPNHVIVTATSYQAPGYLFTTVYGQQYLAERCWR